VIDQGADDSVNAVSIRRFVHAGHRGPDHHRHPGGHVDPDPAPDPRGAAAAPSDPVFQVPIPEPLRLVEPSEMETRRMHAEADYSRMWLYLYEDIVTCGEITIGARYPVLVNRRHLMDPSPIPRWDVARLNGNPALMLFCAGREKRIYALPPHTVVEPLEFEDFPFRPESFDGRRCMHCGSTHSFLDEIVEEATGRRRYACSDSAFCEKARKAGGGVAAAAGKGGAMTGAADGSGPGPDAAASAGVCRLPGAHGPGA
jgi:alpha-D-ribose 1-methylphosphonate 5-phosphate C-P lyase